MSNNNNDQNETRKERYKTSENSSMLVKLSVGLVGLLLLALVFNYFLGGSNEDSNQVAGANDQSEFSMIKKDSSADDLEESVTSSESQVEESSSQEVDQKDSSEDKEKDLEKKEVETNDSNVKKAVVANWEPIGTKQSEPHVTNYDDGSQDRLEMKEAVSQATGVNGNDMVVNWVGNDGDQKVTSTITQSSTGIIYKIYLQWITNEGWKVNKVEELYTVIR